MSPEGNFFRSGCVVIIDETTVNDDAELIEQTLAGRSAAFGLLVRKYQNRLYNVVLHVVGNVEDAEDVVQEAFVQAYLKLGGFERKSAFYTWLYQIAFHAAIDRTRSRRRGPTRTAGNLGDLSEVMDRGEGPTERLDRQERQQQVRQALDQLDEDHRAVLVLRELDGCCYETIAEILNVPIGTVRSRLHRARLQMRQLLQEQLAAKQRIE